MPEITATRLADVARALAHAGQWPHALELLAAASPGGGAEHAGLARDTGQETRARTLAEEAGRWAHVLGIGLLEKQAAALAG